MSVPSFAATDGNDKPSLTAVSSVDDVTIVRLVADPATGALLVSLTGSGGTGTWYTVSGTIDGANVTFTIPVSPTSDIVLVLARQVQAKTIDYSLSGSTITMTYAPDASLSGQPFQAFVIS